MTKPAAEITVPEVIDRFLDYKKRPNNGAWGSLHIVLDDNNVHDDNVKFCYEYALEHKDYEGAELAKILLKMSKSQRLKIGRMG